MIIQIGMKQIPCQISISCLQCGTNKTFLGLSSKMSCCVEGELTQTDRQCCCHVVAYTILQPNVFRVCLAEEAKRSFISFKMCWTVICSSDQVCCRSINFGVLQMEQIKSVILASTVSLQNAFLEVRKVKWSIDRLNVKLVSSKAVPAGRRVCWAKVSVVVFCSNGGRPADLRPAQTTVCFYHESGFIAAGLHRLSMDWTRFLGGCVLPDGLCGSHSPEETFERVSFMWAKW